MNDSIALGLPACDLGTCSCVSNGTAGGANGSLPSCNTTACACVFTFDTPTFALLAASYAIPFLLLTALSCACLLKLKMRPERFDAVVATDKILGGIVVREKASASRLVSMLLKALALLFLAVGPATLLGLWGGFTAVMTRKGGGPTT